MELKNCKTLPLLVFVRLLPVSLLLPENKNENGNRNNNKSDKKEVIKKVKEKKDVI